MREINFRGKRLDNGEWVIGNLFISQMSGCFILLSKIDIKKHRDGGRTMGDKLEQYDVIPETVGQYTGLKDKNGVEIFEGDILLFKDDMHGHIIYNSALCAFLVVNEYKRGDSYKLGGFSSLWIEIVGIVHDNSDLLKEDKPDER